MKREGLEEGMPAKKEEGKAQKSMIQDGSDTIQGRDLEGGWI